MFSIHLTQRPIIAWERSKPREESVGWMFLVISIVSGGTYSTFAKPLTDAFSPLSLIFVSEVLTLFFLLFSFGVIPTFRQIWRIRREMIRPLLTIGIFSGTLAPLLWFTGLHTTSAVNASLFGNAELVFMLVMATVILNESWSRARIAAAASILLGIVVIALKGFTDGIELQPGDVLILLSCLCFSIGSITFRKYLHHSVPQLAMITRSLIAILVFFLLSPLQHKPFIEELQTFPPLLVPTLVGFAFIAKFTNVFSFYQALDRLPVSTTSMLGSLSVIVSAVFAHVILGESIHWYHICGGVLIISGGLLLELFGHRKDQTEQLRQRMH